jgi:hypothetical protein
MKVIFLDNDGVICLSNNRGSRFLKQKQFGDENHIEARFDDFDKKSVDVVNEIINQTNADIVISSDWKNHASLEELKEYYRKQGIVKQPIDTTENFHFENWKKQGIVKSHDEFPWSRELDLEQNRYFEIKKWLDEHKEVTSWVCVDDLHLGRFVESSTYGPYRRDSWGLENFVWTPREDQGITQPGVKEKILNFLI